MTLYEIHKTLFIFIRQMVRYCCRFAASCTFNQAWVISTFFGYDIRSISKNQYWIYIHIIYPNWALDIYPIQIHIHIHLKWLGCSNWWWLVIECKNLHNIQVAGVLKIVPSTYILLAFYIFQVSSNLPFAQRAQNSGLQATIFSKYPWLDIAMMMIFGYG